MRFIYLFIYFLIYLYQNNIKNFYIKDSKYTRLYINESINRFMGKN